VIVFTTAAAFAWIAAWIAVKTIPLRGPAASWQAFPGRPWLDGWVRWDAMWYVNLATDGYWYRPGEQSPVAYFPGYALAIRGAAIVARNPIVAGILVTLVCGLGVSLLFYRWSRAKLDDRTATLAVLTLLSYPFAFYLYGAVYSDALFLLVALAAFVLVEADRPILAGFAGAVASGTRAVGLAVAVGLAIRAYERAKEENALSPRRFLSFGVVIAPLGLVAYMAFLWSRFDDPLAFVHVMSAPGWAQPPGPATWFKLTFVHDLVHGPGFFIRLRLLVHAAVTVGALALAVPVYRRFGPAYAAYTLLVIGIPAVSSKDFVGLGRYVLAAFPAFAVVGEWLAGRPLVSRVWIGASAIAMLACTAAFAVGVYVS
jgi:hypothetical protein